jgi:hypothetical protein
MGGNIQWFRWHHGSVTDPKFGRAARKAKVILPVVIAVWCALLERASASDDRGNYSGIDCADLDYLLGIDDGQTASVIAAMQEIGLLDSGRVCAWESRQPARERGDSSTDRVAKFRAKQNQVTPCNATVTPSNAKLSHETPRVEKSCMFPNKAERRVEKIRIKKKN